MFKSKPSATRDNTHPYFDLPLVMASGLGRSGTTVLRNCLCAHPQIAGHNQENNYLHDLMRAADQNLEHADRTKNMATSQADYWAAHRQLVLDLVWPTQATPTDNAPPQALSTYTMLDPRAAIGLKKTFPRIAICYIIRNGIEVVSSYLSFPPFRNLSFGEICRLWALRHDMFQFANKHKHVFLFRYEWFQDQPRFVGQLTQALRSVGLPFDPACTTPLDTIYHPTNFRGETKQDAADISKRQDRWKLWTDQQRTEFVDICGPAMKAQGYPIPWH